MKFILTCTKKILFHNIYLLDKYNVKILVSDNYLGSSLAILLLCKSCFWYAYKLKRVKIACIYSLCSWGIYIVNHKVPAISDIKICAPRSHARWKMRRGTKQIRIFLTDLSMGEERYIWIQYIFKKTMADMNPTLMKLWVYAAPRVSPYTHMRG